jgi:hypothetical protein
MGWLFSNRWESQKEVEIHLVGQIEQAGYKVLDKSSCWGEFYALCERQDGERDIFVALIKGTKPTNRKSGEFGYKSMCESVHPYAYNCPERLLSQSSDQSEHAIDWREKCRKLRKEKSLQAKVLKSLKAGDKLLTSFGELIFQYRHKSTQFIAERVDNGKTFRYNVKHIKVEV